MLPSDLIEKHFRLVPTQKAALKRLGLLTLENLLRHAPARYDHAGGTGSVSGLTSGQQVTLYGTLSKLEAKKLWKSRRTATTGYFEDGTGRIKVMWFNQPYIAKMAPQGVVVRLTGVVAGKDKPYITNPEIERVSSDMVPSGFIETPGSFGEIAADARRGESDEKDVLNGTTIETQGPRNKADAAISPKLFPVYPESRGITSLWFYHALLKLFSEGVHEKLEDAIPDEVLARLHLPRLAPSLVFLHTPNNERDAEAARKRFAFEEIFVIQAAKHMERAENDDLTAPVITVVEENVDTFIKTLPYPLTGAQKRSIDEILANFRKPHPMARLLEGDVGAGKTAVAAATAYAAVTSRPPNRESGTLQVAYMAPTEILATQHFHSFIEYYKHLPINIALMTGSGCWKFPSKSNKDKPTSISRSQLLKWIANGEIAMLVGTHALIQKKVVFQNLAYAIVDEQHRFGTKQRRELSKKNGAAPHFLSMTATPIPRTLALTLYGDLDLSVLDELPPNRAGVETKVVTKTTRDTMYETMRKELLAGRQAYVVCPRIDEPDPEKEMALRAKSAKAEADRLKKEVFPEYEIGLMHGKLKPAEKDAVMAEYIAGKTRILVSTSVIEVGVNVPNATVMLIEGAERFGLAQLHQLRGRIQRSSHRAFCFLLPDTSSAISLARLKVLAKTSNGFELAEADLAQRGAGDLYGKQQWGVSDLGMEALRNPRLIQAARTEAASVVAEDPKLGKHPALLVRATHVSKMLHEE